MSITPITNAASLSIANNVYLATCLHIVNTGSTVRTLTIANTISPIAPLAFGLVEDDPSPSSQLQKAKEARARIKDKVIFFRFSIIK